MINFIFETLVFTASFFTVGFVIEAFNDTKKDQKRWRTIAPQIKHSLPTIIVGNVFAKMFRRFLDPYGPFFNYYEDHDYSMWMFIQNLVIYIFTWETMFYWIHRLLHVQRPINLYRMFHKDHHYTEVTGWAAFAVHPVELLCLTFILHIPKFLTPIPTFVHYGFLLGTSILSSIAHDKKFDFFDHHRHHSNYLVNYSAYFPFWDNICNTRGK